MKRVTIRYVTKGAHTLLLNNPVLNYSHKGLVVVQDGNETACVINILSITEILIEQAPAEPVANDADELHMHSLRINAIAGQAPKRGLL